MKKMFLIAAIVLTSFVAVKADTYDFLNRDGSAYRVNVTEDWSGHTTISGSHVTRDQRVFEQAFVFIVKTIVWLSK